ncbi:MAG: 8-oxoguanine deaminase [Candidatus Celerinatantimonas neptuna]|nr:MAG: 8-oxoguanine deaminase [Candidatus Celerinatantimonas neptuna]
MTRYYAPQAYLPQGWTQNVIFDVSQNGFIRDIQIAPFDAQCEKLDGPVVPGMPNLHSHAFQRAMAGLAEQRTNPHDSFWSWREQMYHVALNIPPEQLYHIARYLYIELLEGGYTSIAEFHYLHHAPDGTPYRPLDEMADAISQAANDAGIGLTLLPTLYTYSDFAGRPPADTQRRFIQTTEQYLTGMKRLQKQLQTRPNQRLGGCFHSLRACSEKQLQAVVEELPSDWPIHIHISEQRREVEQCLITHNTTPLHWLSQHVDLNSRWTLIHSTHLTGEELSTLAKSGAIAGLCPTTEANLGDGIFPCRTYLNQGGAIGIGSDSHISTCFIEELRWLEYGQRLLEQQRNCLADETTPSTAERLLNEALLGGAKSLAQPIGKLAVNSRADWLVLDLDEPWLNCSPGTHLMDTWLFALKSPAIKDVMVAGRWSLKNGIHPQKQQAKTDLMQTLNTLRGTI